MLICRQSPHEADIPQSVYATRKAAVEGLIHVWATELSHQYGVTVDAVNPGPLDTDMYQAAGPVHLTRMEENKRFCWSEV